MKHMKNLVCILLSLLLLTSCGAPKEENPSLIHIKEQVQNFGKIMGVAYLGNADGDFDAVQTYLNSQEYIKVYPFISDIDASHFVDEEGSELYCVVPGDHSTSIDIYNTKLNETSYQLEKKDKLLSYSDGQPIILRGNVSDIMPNLMIVAKKGDAVTEYMPCLSLENGLMNNSEQSFFEFTPYELMNDFNGTNPETQWGFCGNWTAIVTELNGETYQLNLSATSDSCVELSFASETVSGSYTGNWLILSDQRLRLELGGETIDSKKPGITGLHTDVDAVYFWDVTDGNLTLTYFNGTPFYPTATVTDFLFTPVQ